MQADNEKNRDKEKQLANQRDKIWKVIDWLREEGLEPQELTHLRKDACYYGVVISNEAEKTEQIEKQRREAFHILFPIDKLDSLSISEIIILDLQSQKSYASLAAKTNGILEQNRFYFDLDLALLQTNVHFIINKNMRELQSLEIPKVVFFDGLTKNTLFNTINTVRNSIEIARIKTGQLRDSVLSSKASRADNDNDLN
ncbi:MAG TPA: DUF2299 family protein [Nitrososphaeraceae archaeon]|nr:DUF2299 family protein [Nitrososphaeraceae archaeon]